MTTLDKKIEAAEQELYALRERKQAARARTKVECSKCGEKHMVKTLEYIQTHWYVAPYSCTGGDYWKPGEGQFDCPSCGFNNRLYNRPDVAELKHLFKSVRKTYDK